MTFRCISQVLALLYAGCFWTGISVAQSDATARQSSAPPQQNDEQAQTPRFTFRQTVQRVILDVMVRDKDGKPVHGLTAKDFQVLEGGKPQPILSFDTYTFDKPSISRGPNAPPLPPNVFVNVPSAPEHGPLYVLLYDLVNTDIEDQMSAHGKILKFIQNKPAGTRFAVFINSDELYLAQGFTDDKDALYKLLDGKHSRPHVPKIFLNGRSYGKGDPYTVLDVMTHIAQYLDGIPGRKNLIWVAGTFPAAIFPREGDPVDAQDAIRAETNALAQAQVAIFPLNVRGVVVNCEGCSTGAMPHGGAGGESVGLPPGQAAPNPLSDPTASPVVSAMQVAGKGSSSLVRDYATQEEIASITGGRAFYSTNDLATALEDATEDGGNYYTLTFAPASDMDDGKCHGIFVRTNSGRYQLSYRRTYCRAPLVSVVAENSAGQGASTQTIPVKAGDVLQGNMKQGAPMLHDLVFSAHVRTDGVVAMATPAELEHLQEQAQFFQTGQRKKARKPLPPTRVQQYAIDYRVLDPQIKAQQQSGRLPTLEFAVAAFDSDGKMLNGMVNDGVPETSPQNGENKAGIYRVRQSLAVPVNAVSIRVGVRDRLSDRMGTLEIPLPLKPEPVAKAIAPQH